MKNGIKTAAKVLVLYLATGSILLFLVTRPFHIAVLAGIVLVPIAFGAGARLFSLSQLSTSFFAVVIPLFPRLPDYIRHGYTVVPPFFWVSLVFYGLLSATGWHFMNIWGLSNHLIDRPAAR